MPNSKGSLRKGVFPNMRKLPAKKATLFLNQIFLTVSLPFGGVRAGVAL